MSSMFYGALMFDQPLNSWDVSSVVSMSRMFMYTTFDQSLNGIRVLWLHRRSMEAGWEGPVANKNQRSLRLWDGRATSMSLSPSLYSALLTGSSTEGALHPFRGVVQMAEADRHRLHVGLGVVQQHVQHLAQIRC